MKSIRIIIILSISFIVAALIVYLLHGSLLYWLCLNSGGEFSWQTRLCTDVDTYEEYYMETTNGLWAFYVFIGLLVMAVVSFLTNRLFVSDAHKDNAI